MGRTPCPVRDCFNGNIRTSRMEQEGLLGPICTVCNGAGYIDDGSAATPPRPRSSTASVAGAGRYLLRVVVVLLAGALALGLWTAYDTEDAPAIDEDEVAGVWGGNYICGGEPTMNVRAELRLTSDGSDRMDASIGYYEPAPDLASVFAAPPLHVSELTGTASPVADGDRLVNLVAASEPPTEVPFAIESLDGLIVLGEGGRFHATVESQTCEEFELRPAGADVGE